MSISIPTIFSISKCISNKGANKIKFLKKYGAINYFVTVTEHNFVKKKLGKDAIINE